MENIKLDYNENLNHTPHKHRHTRSKHACMNTHTNKQIDMLGCGAFI